MKASDLRLLHALAALARRRTQSAVKHQTDGNPDLLYALEAVKKVESMARTEMNKANLLPALSTRELRDEGFTEEQLPTLKLVD